MESPPPLNTTVFIYALTEPTGEIRYIGKSIAPARRFLAHLRDKRINHRTCWIKSLRSKGLSPLWESLDEVPEEHWKSWEAAYIQFFLEEGCDLVNRTKGGEGTERGKSLSPETIAKMTGRKLSPEHKEKISAATTGERNPNYGKTPSAGTREKISLGGMGRTPWNKGLTGGHLSLEHKEKLSVAMKGKRNNPNGRRKLV